MIKRFFITLILILIVLVVGLGYYLSDKETLKEELSAQLSTASGYQVEILGDLNWQVLPKLGIAAGNIKLRDGETQIHVNKLRVGLSLSELTKSPERWQLDDLILDEVRIKDAGFRVQEFAMQGFALGQATTFQAQMLMLQAGEPSEVRKDAAPVDVSGTLTYALPDSKKTPGTTLSDLTIAQTTITTRFGEVPINATCAGSLKEIDGAASSETDTLNIYNGQMDCTSAQFSVNSLSWPESEVSLTVKEGKLSTTLQAANGSVDIQKLKETVTSISALAGKENPAANWPNVMQYQRLLVNASLQDEQVVADASLDNLDVAMRGTLAQADSALNLKGTLTVKQATAAQLIRLDPLFTDLPLPFGCQGTAAEPDCGPDTSAAMSIVSELAKREGKRMLQEKVQESLLDGIEEKIPEKLKEGAQQLLNLFKQ
ncbi:MAG: AsmA family protein [Pseudomonadales bacterium]|nr:AsmA family protein [Pseudomonadales bacterium]